MYRLSLRKKLEKNFFLYAETRVQTTNSLTPNTHTFKQNCKKKKKLKFPFTRNSQIRKLKTSELIYKL